MVPIQHNILGLTLAELQDFADRMGEPRYRGTQLFQWLYTRGATQFREMSSLRKDLREQLAQTASISRLSLVTSQRSSIDGTTKFLFALPDGLRIETVLIPPATAFRDSHASREDEQRRLTLCVSSQAGCPLDCKFCATATMGFQRNLTTGEIVDQVLQVKHLTGRRITNIVFMGMGEPLMNYDAVMKAAEIMIGGMGIAARRITVSTAGWADAIRRMADEHRKMKLAVSLHSPVDAVRTRLMPVNKRHPIAELMDAIAYYYSRTKLRVTYEYIFFDGINDSDDDVDRLIRLARRVPCKINVIPFHAIASLPSGGQPPRLRPSPRMDVIVEKLRRNNLTVMVRTSAGEDIDAACGQLAARTGVKRQRAQRTLQPA